MESILPQEVKESAIKRKYGLVGPGTKVILLTSQLHKTNQNVYVTPSQEKLGLKASSISISNTEISKRPRKKIISKDTTSRDLKDESLKHKKLSEHEQCAKENQGKDKALLSTEDLQMIQDFIKSYMANPDILLTPQLAFYRKFIESLGAKVPAKNGISEVAEPKKRDKLKALEKVDPSKEYHCNQCEKVFISSYHLESHIKIHNEEKDKLLMCSICGKQFMSPYLLRSHMTTHTGEKPYKCNQCVRTFRSNLLLINHTRMIHTGERPYKCKYCEKAFSIRFKLKKHLLTHTLDKSYVCTKCKKAFATNANLRVHMLVHSGIRKYVCEQCGKAFAHNSVLRKHMRTHTGEKPFQCSECDLSFAWKGHLDGHMRVHTGERPYQCNQCGNTFAQNYALKKHKRTHTGERPYQCPHCDKKFKYRSSLNEHTKKTNCISNYKEIANGPTQSEPKYNEPLKYSSSINEHMKINRDNIEVDDNATVMTSHVHNAETSCSPNVGVLPMPSVHEYSRYPWYNGSLGWDNIQKTNIPDNKNYCLFRVEQSGTDNRIKWAGH